MFKSKFFIGILTVIVFLAVIAFFYVSVDVDYVKTGGEVVENLERDLNIYLRTKDEEEKRKLEFKIEAAISDGHDIAYEFIPRFYLARSTYFQNKGLYKKAIDDLDMIIDSKWIERDLAYINKAVVYEKMGQPENALLIYDDVIKQTRLDFIKIRALLSKAALIEVRDKKLAVEIYEKISNFSYENNLYINLAKNKLLQLR
ncbi:hypothetical protein BmHG_00131 [Borrelia miyamotoi]|uniref:Tetratricopeptide repeat protein n=1 Tax=Borrelia miyamotoi TaxID=47466 RepID=A0AAP8YW96_9SPIR|nr:hypothetical protein [Borrelia miyamotoi]AHH05289.1 Hypothetical protein BOM_0746 [Borrelia miyamotoi FR64b]ATQ15053.1 hypothetical protein CNO14_03630 [Borrelia miyamotoi]ATQ16236.1 hypothetical protein CNO13_03630 [Borrelia miyamotoi]ATQ17380.1 hypothetical protein CNO12_03635 [Borrelia miyamotoi]ATQ18118.1 hypothetical protein CNO11_00620 [Borrelia miyamotoi]